MYQEKKKVKLSLGTHHMETASTSSFVNALISEVINKQVLMSSKNTADVESKRTYKIIDSNDLAILIRKPKVISYLLVDCTDHGSYNCKRLKYSMRLAFSANPVVNVPSLDTKADVMKYLLEYCPNIIGYLNAPGFYTDIVVYDDKSTPENLPSSKRFLLEAIAEWNKGTRTNTWLLSGGFEAIYPFDGIFVKDLPSIAWTFPASMALFQEYLQTVGQDPPVEVTGSDEGADIKGSFTRYLKNLDSAFQLVWFLTICKRQSKSLDAISLVLTKENRKQQQEFFNNIPAVLKCPVCLEIYSGEIYQCANGHGICPKCLEAPRNCHVCNIPYYIDAVKGKIRCRLLETVMATNSSYCANAVFGCTELLTYSCLGEHIKSCDKVKTMEVKKIEGYEELIEKEVEAATRQLEVVTGENMDMEHKWNLTKIRKLTSVTKELMTIIETKRNRYNKAKLAMDKEILIKDKPVTVKGYMVA